MGDSEGTDNLVGFDSLHGVQYHLFRRRLSRVFWSFNIVCVCESVLFLSFDFITNWEKPRKKIKLHDSLHKGTFYFYCLFFSYI